MSGERSLNRAELIELLTELGTELDAIGVRGELFIVGGAAMALAFDTRRLTTDIDAAFEPTTTIREAAARVASRHPGIAEEWINEAMKGFPTRRRSGSTRHPRRARSTCNDPLA